MPRRVKTKQQRRTWRWYATMGLDGLLAVSMVLGTIFLFGGVSPQPAAPTLALPTANPNQTLAPPKPQATLPPPTAAAASPTPASSANPTPAPVARNVPLGGPSAWSP